MGCASSWKFPRRAQKSAFCSPASSDPHRSCRRGQTAATRPPLGLKTSGPRLPLKNGADFAFRVGGGRGKTTSDNASSTLRVPRSPASAPSDPRADVDINDRSSQDASSSPVRWPTEVPHPPSPAKLEGICGPEGCLDAEGNVGAGQQISVSPRPLRVSDHKQGDIHAPLRLSAHPVPDGGARDLGVPSVTAGLLQNYGRGPVQRKDGDAT